MKKQHNEYPLMRFGMVCSILAVIAIFGLAQLGAQDIRTVLHEGVQHPVANIEGNFNVHPLDKVRLDGSFSYDPRGRSSSLIFKWELVSKPKESSATLLYSGPNASFGADVVGTYKVKLIVNNGFEDSEPAYAIITVTKKGYE
ncbi:MAG TPA: hypothetical protein VEI96_06630 [Thermodesulfovibrionales bacterium]|nr:hypothetical protein [Thermodesulfovibrionales bacterium]